MRWEVVVDCLRDLFRSLLNEVERNRKSDEDLPQQMPLNAHGFAYCVEASHFASDDYNHGSGHIFCESETIDTNMATV
jgi:hypothetical protein